MSGYGGPDDPGVPPPRPGHPYDPAAYPPTQALPQQLPTPAHGVPAHRPPTPTWQVVLITILVVVCVGALVFFLLVLFGVVGDDDSAPVETIDQPVAPTVTAEGQVPAIAQTVFRCPDGSMGSPTPEDPNCVVAESTEMVAATQVEETTYRCPEGASGSPNEARPECAASASGAVAAIATTTLLCPQGSTGSPTPSNPVCDAPNQQVQVSPLAVTVFECQFDEQLDEDVEPPECVRQVAEFQDVPRRRGDHVRLSG